MKRTTAFQPAKMQINSSSFAARLSAREGINATTCTTRYRDASGVQRPATRFHPPLPSASATATRYKPRFPRSSYPPVVVANLAKRYVPDTRKLVRIKRERAAGNGERARARKAFNAKMFLKSGELWRITELRVGAIDFAFPFLPKRKSTFLGFKNRSVDLYAARRSAKQASDYRTRIRRLCRGACQSSPGRVRDVGAS